MKSLTNWRSRQARSPLQIAMTGKQTLPSTQRCPWKPCQGHSKMISCSSQQPTRQGQRNQCCWACSSTGECRVGCLPYERSMSLSFVPGVRLGAQLCWSLKHKVRVWSLSGELIGKVIVTLEKWLQQYCSNTVFKLSASERNLTPVSLLVVPTHFFQLLCVS